MFAKHEFLDLEWICDTYSVESSKMSVLRPTNMYFRCRNFRVEKLSRKEKCAKFCAFRVDKLSRMDPIGKFRVDKLSRMDPT